MRMLLLALVVVVTRPAVADAGVCMLLGSQSTIGMYITERPTVLEDTILDAPVAGVYTVYLVCADPENEGGTPISTLGGFECELSFSGGWGIQGVALQGGVLDFDANLEAFYCSGLMTVSSGFVTLATISLINYTPAKGWVWISPYSPAPSIPGQMAITDADDGYSLAPAEPSSLDYDRPIFGINQGAEQEDESWSGVKALFQ